VDFFVHNLEGENCLIVPPVDLISRSLHYLYARKATATLVVPFWPSSAFWPVISRKYSRFILGSKLFRGKDALKHGRNTNSLLGSDSFYGEVLSMRMKFDLYNSSSYLVVRIYDCSVYEGTNQKEALAGCTLIRSKNVLVAPALLLNCTHNWVLKTSAPLLAGPICSIFNASIAQSRVPTLWKSADVLPLPKISYPKSVDSELRPISPAPVLSKLLEGFVFSMAF
jgi:hypothetical protein